MKKLINKLKLLRKKAFEKEGSYEDSYTFLMEGIDKILMSVRK